MTDETKNTAGPWAWHGDELLSPAEFVMATTKGNRPSDNDARLIAAAPDLLEALQKALNYLQNTEEEFGITLDSADACRAAIAKAEGCSK